VPIKRSELVEADRPGLYHCISRCVRRAFLCGGKGNRFDPRRQWLEKRLQELAGLFAIDVLSYAIMSNHLHVLVWTDPERGEDWDALEIARRWLTLFPKSIPLGIAFEDAVRALAADHARIEQLRPRLSSLSWFNRCLKEPLARRANAEDGCTGAFWEGRFRSYRVLGEAGALTCSVYIDLNAVRAGLAETPESSKHTSVRERIRVRQESWRKQLRRDRRRAASGRSGDDQAAHCEDGLWLAPLSRESARRSGRRSLLDIGVDAYLRLVDAAGRRLRSNKRGSIPGRLRPILERLEYEVEEWLGALGRELEDLWGTTVGQPADLAEEAIRRGRRWVVDPLQPRE
jgi:hypothetical protein